MPLKLKHLAVQASSKITKNSELRTKNNIRLAELIVWTSIEEPTGTCYADCIIIVRYQDNSGQPPIFSFFKIIRDSHLFFPSFKPHTTQTPNSRQKQNPLNLLAPPARVRIPACISLPQQVSGRGQGSRICRIYNGHRIPKFILLYYLTCL